MAGCQKEYSLHQSSPPMSIEIITIDNEKLKKAEQANK